MGSHPPSGTKRKTGASLSSVRPVEKSEIPRQKDSEIAFGYIIPNLSLPVLGVLRQQRSVGWFCRILLTVYAVLLVLIA